MTSVDTKPVLHLLIEGRVQGVGFRYSTQQQASTLNLCGWIKNLNDGRVELVAQGRLADINAFFEWCHTGPEFAHVTRCTELVSPDSVDATSFMIMR